MDEDKPYEEMTDAELEALTEQVVREHESGLAPLSTRDDTATRIAGTVPISLRIPHRLLDSI